MRYNVATQIVDLCTALGPEVTRCDAHGVDGSSHSTPGDRDTGTMIAKVTSEQAATVKMGELQVAQYEVHSLDSLHCRRVLDSSCNA